MKNKILIIICLIFFISLSCVSASDINQTGYNVDNTILSASNDVNVDNILSANENIDENYTLTLSNDNDVLSDEGEFVDASEGYERLNAFRTENGVWQWNEDDTTKTVFNTDDSNQLKPLVRDTALEETAKIRAKELAIKYDHTRPDGSSCWTAFPDGYGWMGENIAMGQRTWNQATESWKETNDLYDGQGHRRNMLNPNFNSVGVAGYKLNGVIYWAQDFGGKYNAEELTNIDPEDVFTVKNNTQNPEFNIQLPNDATGTFSVRVDGNVIDSEVLSNGKATITANSLSEGLHEVILSYGGDSNYYTINKVTSVNVLDDSTPVVPTTDIIISAPDVTKYYHGSERFVVTLTDNKGNPLANKTVTFNINGVIYTRTTNANGTTNIVLRFNSGVYNVTTKVDNQTANSVITILTTVNGTDVVETFGENILYYATLRDSEGNYLKEGTEVRVNFNGIFRQCKVVGDKGLIEFKIKSYESYRNVSINSGTLYLTVENPVTGEKCANSIPLLRISEVYVNSSAGENGDGSKNNPFKDLKIAITAVDDNGTVYIAPGLYTGKNNTNLNIYINRSITISNWTVGNVIFDGENKNRFSDIFSMYNESTIKINGLTFKNCINCMNFYSWSEIYDKHLDDYMYYNGNLTYAIINCDFINNSGKNIISNTPNLRFSTYYINYTISNSNFINNTCSYAIFNKEHNGGWGNTIEYLINNCNFINNNDVIYNYFYQKGILRNCSFINNSECVQDHEGNISDCSFINNSGNCVWGDSNITNSYFINNNAASIIRGRLGIVDNCLFVNNKNSYTCINADFISITNCSFINNDGSAINTALHYDNYHLIKNCSFINNSAGYDDDGGAIYIYNIRGYIYQIYIIDSYFINNSASGSGGAIYCSYRPYIYQIDNIELINVVNSTFINNSAMYGGAIFGASAYNSTFINNSASSGSAIFNVGCMQSATKDSIHVFNGTVNSYIRDCLFDGNYFKYFENATNYGNTIYLNGYDRLELLKIFGDEYYDDEYYEIVNEIEIGLLNCSIDNCIFKNNDGKHTININSLANVSLNNNELNNELIYNNNGTITSPTSIIVLDNKTISSHSNEVMLTANIFDDNGNNIVCDDFNFTLNNKSIKGTLDYDTFKANTTLDDGKYIVGAEVNNLTDNTVKIGIIDVNTTQEVIIITAHDVTKYYGNSKQLTVTVTKNGSPFADAEIKISLDGNTYTKTTNNKGEAYLPIDLDSGIYDATITYTNSSSLVPAKVVKITVKPVNTEINLSYVQDSRNSVTLTTIVNSTNATGDIVFNVNGKEYTSKISNSKATYTLNNLEIGTYAVNASYAGDINHKSSNSDNLTFTIEDVIIITAPDVTKYYGGSERFIVTLKDKDNKAIAGENVAITINGQKYIRTTNSDGEASMAINLNSGEYVAVSQCNGHNATSKVTVLSTISAKDVTKIFRNGTQYYATFLDTKGNLLKNTPVTFNINGVFYTRNTDEKGVARLNINLNPGTYLITAKNPNSAEDYSNNITVLSSIVENHDIVKYYKNDTQYWVRILNDDGSVAGAGVSVTFNINGVFYTRTTNESGYVRLNINLNPNTYIITVMYNGLSVSNTIKVLPVLSANNLNMHYRDGSKFEAKLVDGQGNVLANQLITFNINGVFYDRMTNDNGIAMLNINLMAGKYIITSMYSNGASISNNVTIKLRLD